MTILVTTSKYDDRFGGERLTAAEHALMLGRVELEEILTEAIESAAVSRGRLSGPLAYGKIKVRLGNPNAAAGEENPRDSDLEAVVLPAVVDRDFPLGMAWRVHIVETSPDFERFVGAGLLPQVMAIVVRRERPTSAYEVVALDVYDPTVEPTAMEQERRLGEVVAFARYHERRKRVLSAFSLGTGTQ